MLSLLRSPTPNPVTGISASLRPRCRDFRHAPAREDKPRPYEKQERKTLQLEHTFNKFSN